VTGTSQVMREKGQGLLLGRNSQAQVQVTVTWGMAAAVGVQGEQGVRFPWGRDSSANGRAGEEEEGLGEVPSGRTSASSAPPTTTMFLRACHSGSVTLVLCTPRAAPQRGPSVPSSPPAPGAPGAAGAQAAEPSTSCTHCQLTAVTVGFIGEWTFCLSARGTTVKNTCSGIRQAKGEPSQSF